MMFLKRNQIVVFSLVMVIVVASYLQYSSKNVSWTTSKEGGEKFGEAVYVDGDPADGGNEEGKMTAGGAQAVSADGTDGMVVEASKTANDFFAQAKLDREVTRGKDAEALKGISEDVQTAADSKALAFQKMMTLIDRSEKEMRLETLIIGKGFGDAVALLGDDGGIDIIVKAPSLTSSQVAQITDIVTRQANIPISLIRVKNIY